MSISTVTQDQFTTAETLMLETVRSSYSGIDTRRGTAIRDLVVRPSSTLQAYTAENANAAAGASSLERMRQEGGDIDVDAVNAILSNFNTTYKDGDYASGYVRMVFSSNGTRLLTSGFGVTANLDTALRFEIPESLSITADSSGTLTYEEMAIGGETVYTVPIRVVATGKGTIYNIPTGTYFTPDTGLIDVVDCLAMSSFSGGAAAETIDEVIARLPVAIASRSLTNSVSVKALLSDYYGSSIAAVNLQGMMSETQQRNKVFGIGVGGYVDAYIRSFASPAITIIPKTGTPIAGGYTVTLIQAESAGVYGIRAISDWNGVYSPIDSAASSYTYASTRAIGSSLGIHKIDDTAQAAFTCYQQLTVTVYDALAGAETKEFKLELLTAPGILDMQTYCDSEAVRNTGVDFVLKTPIVARTSMNVTVYLPTGTTDTVSAIRTRIVDVINGNSFVPILGLAAIVQAIGYRVDMGPGKLTLACDITGASGVSRKITGCGDIDIRTVTDTTDYITPDTVVFAADPADIQITQIMV